jgi:DUF1016 N-terminal domain
MPQRDLDLKGQESGKLLIEIRILIEEARRQTAVAVNIGLALLYWHIGRRIHREVLGSERAAYGEQIVVTLSRQLVVGYPRATGTRSLMSVAPGPSVSSRASVARNRVSLGTPTLQ